MAVNLALRTLLRFYDECTNQVPSWFEDLSDALPWCPQKGFLADNGQSKNSRNNGEGNGNEDNRHGENGKRHNHEAEKEVVAGNNHDDDDNDGGGEDDSAEGRKVKGKDKKSSIEDGDASSNDDDDGNGSSSNEGEDDGSMGFEDDEDDQGDDNDKDASSEEESTRKRRKRDDAKHEDGHEGSSNDDENDKERGFDEMGFSEGDPWGYCSPRKKDQQCGDNYRLVRGAHLFMLYLILHVSFMVQIGESTCVRIFPLESADLVGAGAACEAQGADLVEITSHERQRDLEVVLDDLRRRHPAVFGEVEDVWIGGIWSKASEAWEWKNSPDQEFNNYTNWGFYVEGKCNAQ